MTTLTQSESARDLTPGWTPEMRFLLKCVRNASARAQFSEEPLEAIHWDSVLKHAERHGLSGLLYQQMTAITPSPMPTEYRSFLEGLHRANVQRGLRLMAVLMNVMGLFRENHLRALPYKGPTLSAQIFGNAAVRDAADLDILLPVDHARKAYDLLTKHGFQPIRPYTPAVMDQLFRYRAEIGLVRDEILLELQWRLAPKYFSVEMDVEAVVARAGSIPFGNAQVPVMAPEDNLLALCIHGAKHQWQTLKWIVDVDLFVRRHPELSWATVTTRATTSGTLRMLLTTLFLSQELMATPLPPGVAQQMLSDPEATALAKSCIAMLQSGEEPTEAQHHRFMLRLRERTKDRMLYVARLAYQPTESEWDAIALPRGLVWLYYGVRAGRVFFKSLRLLLP